MTRIRNFKTICTLAGLTMGALGVAKAAPTDQALKTLGRIAFSSDRAGNAEIYTVRGDGGDFRRLTRDSGPFAPDDTQPSLGDGGRRLVWVCTRGAQTDLWIMNATGTGQTRLTFDEAEETDPALSPDGSRVAYVRGGHIHILDVRTRRSRRLTTTGLANAHPAWSPDGKQIVWEQDFDSTANDGLYLMNADGSNPRRIPNTGRGLSGAFPRFSPDGRRIAFVVAQPDGARQGTSDLCVINRDGSGLKTVLPGLTQRAGRQVRSTQSSPAWSPDGKRILFSSDISGARRLMFITPEGLGLRALMPRAGSGVDVEPDWALSPKLKRR